MAIHLLLWGNSTPPNELLDGAIVVVEEIAYGVVVTVPAPQVAVSENRNYAAIAEDPARPFVTVGDGYVPVVAVTEVDKPIAKILEPRIPVAVVTENTSGAETR